MKVHLVRAEPTSAILAFVEQERPDLLVIGTHGRSGWSRWLLGSVAQNLVRSAPCPVLTVPRPLTDGTSPAANKRGFQRILVAVDFSSCARAALLHASELARHFGASLEVVHAWDIAPVLAPDVTLGGGMASPTLASAAIEEARSAMSEFVRVAGESGVRIDHAHLERGPAARVIIDLVARANYDLLAIGTHGRSGISRLLLGSVAEQVVRRSTRPVLSVRAA